MAADTTAYYLNEGHKRLLKLRKKLKRVDLDFTVQATVSSVDKKIRYASSLTSPVKGVAPIMHIASTGKEFLEKLDRSIENMDQTAIEKAYHAAQLQACERTIDFHKERLLALDEEPVVPLVDDTAEPATDTEG